MGNRISGTLPVSRKAFFEGVNEIAKTIEVTIRQNKEINAKIEETEKVVHQELFSEINDQKKVNEQLWDKIRELEKRGQSTQEQIQQKLNLLLESQHNILAEIKDLRERFDTIYEQGKKTFAETRYCHRMIKPRTLYQNITEREALVSSFSLIMEGATFEKKFLRLTLGLDEKSRKTVIRILTRMKQILDGNTNLLDLFNEEEQNELQKLRESFSSQVLQLTDSLYCYDKYLLPVNQFDPSVFYSRYGIDRLKKRAIDRSKNIIDVGGYVGDTALLFSPLTDNNVYVFEAAPENYTICKQTIEINGIKNVICENLALGDRRGTIEFSLGERGSCNTLIERPGYIYTDKIEVPITTLDDYVKENDLSVGLIKMDVEGAEQMVLRGAVDTIREQKPILLISIYHSAKDFFDIKPMIEDMGLGYQFQIYKPINNAIVMETLLIAET